MGDLSKEAVAEAIRRQAAEAEAAKPKSMFDRLRESLSLPTTAQLNAQLGEVGEKFGKGGCEAISSRPGLKALDTFSHLSATEQAAIPNSDKLKQAVTECKI